jgi:hypothetical protein
VSRPLSLQDRIALIYTSAGSQRAVARQLGISHQKVGRILKTGQEGGYRPDSKALRDPILIAQIERGFIDHKRIVRETAKAQGLPYSAAVPVFYGRLPRGVTRTEVDRQTGEIRRVPVIDPATGRQQVELGDRAVAPHVHWLSDKLRGDWIRAVHKTQKFAGVSIASLVNLKLYFKRADERMRGQKRTPEQRQWRKEMRERIKRAEIQAASMEATVYTKTVPMDFAAETVVKRIDRQLREKHQPATGPDLAGTKLAAQILLQIDPRGKDEKPATKKPQARRKAR